MRPTAFLWMVIFVLGLTLSSKAQYVFKDSADYKVDVIYGEVFKSPDKQLFFLNPIGNSGFNYYKRKRKAYLERIDLSSLKVLRKRELDPENYGEKAITLSLGTFNGKINWTIRVFSEEKVLSLIIRQVIDPLSLENEGVADTLFSVNASRVNGKTYYGSIIHRTSKDQGSQVFIVRVPYEEGDDYVPLRILAFDSSMNLIWERRKEFPFSPERTFFSSFHLFKKDLGLLVYGVESNDNKQEKQKYRPPHDLHFLFIGPSEETSSQMVLPSEGSYLRNYVFNLKNDTLHGMVSYGGPDPMSDEGFIGFRYQIEKGELIDLKYLSDLYIDIIKSVPEDYREEYFKRVAVENGNIQGFFPQRLYYSTKNQHYTLAVQTRYDHWIDGNRVNGNQITAPKVMNHWGDYHYILISKDWELLKTNRVPFFLSTLDKLFSRIFFSANENENTVVIYQYPAVLSNSKLREDSMDYSITDYLKYGSRIGVVVFEGEQNPKRIELRPSDKFKHVILDSDSVTQIGPYKYILLVKKGSKSFYMLITLDSASLDHQIQIE
ncbi:MAG: hypothetical protein LPK46_01200 [Bacteroidota bacterium]|nr:hypothetical protein [Bacteroidota bacterium]MDX5504733.1 hypothetical protein [Bacteroidota bacterium]